MMVTGFITFNILYILLGFTLIVGFILGVGKEVRFLNLKSIEQEKINLDELTVIVPFRNERHRIENLLRSWNSSQKLPTHIIFVDDHSTDETSRFIEEVLKNTNYTILPATLEGKKHAIALGIEHASTQSILTFDADVKFDSLYFENLEKLNKADLIILPVKMIGKNWRKIFEIDVDLANTLNVAISGFGKPILASGANLFFSKKAYLEYNSLSKHQHLKSGDDVFLLNDFKNNNASVQLVTDPNLAVVTATPATFSEYFHQRLRWIGKTVALKNRTTTMLALVQFLLSITFYTLIVIAISQNEVKSLMYLLASKIVTDYATTIMYYKRISKSPSAILIVLYQLVSPVISVLLGMSMIFYTPKWKDRKVA